MDEDTLDEALSNMNVTADVTMDQEDQQPNTSCSSSDQSNLSIDPDWENEFSKVYISRKRKSTEPTDGGNYGNVAGRRVLSAKSAKRPTLSGEAKNLDRLQAKVFSERKILRVMIQCLPDVDLRRLASVNSEWRTLTYQTLRNRKGSGPFILRWKTEEDLSYDDFGKGIQLHYDPLWLGGEGTLAVPQLSTILSFSTPSLWLGLKDFNCVPPIIGQQLNFICAIGSQLVASIPTGPMSSLKVSDSAYFALQSLCIPWHANFICTCVSVPVWTPETHDLTLRALIDRHFVTRDELVQAHKPMKWFLILRSLCEDRLTMEFTDAYITGACHDWNQVRGIMATVDGIVSNTWHINPDKEQIVSTVLNIHGRETALAETFAFHLKTLRNLSILQFYAQSFFANSDKSFAILVYRPSVTIESLTKLKEALGDVLLIGVQSDQPISFQGTFFNEDSRIVVQLFNSAELDVDVAIGFIKY